MSNLNDNKKNQKILPEEYPIILLIQPEKKFYQ